MTSPLPDNEPVRQAAVAVTAASRLEIDAAWAVRLLAGLSGAAGLYAVSTSLSHILRGERGGTWLLPLTTGALTVLLAALVAMERGQATIVHGALARRIAAAALLGIYAFVLLPWLGFLVASSAFVLAIAAFYAPRRLAVGLSGVAIVAGLWALFAFVLAEPLPRGLWWR